MYQGISSWDSSPFYLSLRCSGGIRAAPAFSRQPASLCRPTSRTLGRHPVICWDELETEGLLRDRFNVRLPRARSRFFTIGEQSCPYPVHPSKGLDVCPNRELADTTVARRAEGRSGKAELCAQAYRHLKILSATGNVTMSQAARIPISGATSAQPAPSSIVRRKASLAAVSGSAWIAG